MPLEFPAEAVGTTAKCPACRRQTELHLAAPEQPSGIPKRAIVWTVIAVFVLLIGLLAALAALNRAKNLANERKQLVPVSERR